MEESKGGDPGGQFLFPYEKYCTGYTYRGPYVLAMHLAAVAVSFDDIVSDNLRRICAFDAAEIAETNVGQLNAMTVSSFCGPHGLIWGYHIAQPATLRDELIIELPTDAGTLPVYSGEPLVRASRTLLGTQDAPRFPIFPGSHTPVAMKDSYCSGPGWVYAVTAIGIVDARAGESAHILMEDVGSWTSSPPMSAREMSIQCARSTQIIAQQQRSRIKEIFVSTRIQKVNVGEMGCALSFLPYIHLAAQAVPGRNMENIKGMELALWETSFG